MSRCNNADEDKIICFIKLVKCTVETFSTTQIAMNSFVCARRRIEQIDTRNLSTVFISIGFAEQHSKNCGKSNSQKNVFYQL